MAKRRILGLIAGSFLSFIAVYSSLGSAAEDDNPSAGHRQSVDREELEDRIDVNEFIHTVSESIEKERAQDAEAERIIREAFRDIKPYITEEEEKVGAMCYTDDWMGPECTKHYTGDVVMLIKYDVTCGGKHCRIIIRYESDWTGESERDGGTREGTYYISDSDCNGTVDAYSGLGPSFVLEDDEIPEEQREYLEELYSQLEEELLGGHSTHYSEEDFEDHTEGWFGHRY